MWLRAADRASGACDAQRAFAADATPQSRDFLVNVTTAGDQSRPAIAAGPTGTVVVVWEANGPQAPSWLPKPGRRNIAARPSA